MGSYLKASVLTVGGYNEQGEQAGAGGPPPRPPTTAMPTASACLVSLTDLLTAMTI